MRALSSMLGGLAWRKTQRSVGNGACVEVATAAEEVLIRDSTESGLGTFTCTTVEWRMFADSVRRRTLPSSVDNSISAAGSRTISAGLRWISALWNVTPYRPRDRFSPRDAIDAIERHISRSTETDEYRRRYSEMLRATSAMVSSLTRSVLSVMITLFVCCLIWLTAITFAIKYEGLPQWAALSFGASGPIAFVLAAFRGIRYLKDRFGAPTDRTQKGPGTDHQ
jgi:Domain of unknown function (DUF397)